MRRMQNELKIKDSLISRFACSIVDSDILANDPLFKASHGYFDSYKLGECK